MTFGVFMAPWREQSRIVQEPSQPLHVFVARELIPPESDVFTFFCSPPKTTSQCRHQAPCLLPSHMTVTSTACLYLDKNHQLPTLQVVQ